MTWDVGISGQAMHTGSMTTTAPLNAMATADDLSVLYSVPVGTIYRWASLDRWRRTRYARPVRYDMADADKSFRTYRESPLDT